MVLQTQREVCNTGVCLSSSKVNYLLRTLPPAITSGKTKLGAAFPEFDIAIQQCLNQPSVYKLGGWQKLAFQLKNGRLGRRTTTSNHKAD